MSDVLDEFLDGKPEFGGDTYDRTRDRTRLSAQYQRVFDLMRDGQARTLEQIERTTGDSSASVSARLRDMRKPAFGGHTVERKHLGAGLFAYRLVLNAERTAA